MVFRTFLFKKQTLISVLVICFTVGQAAAAEKFYRYRNDAGVLVLDYQVPPHLVKNGYEVVSASGQVLEVVPAYQEQTAEDRRAAELAQQQALEDKMLLKSYSSIEELNRARNRKLEGIQREIDIITTNISESNVLLDGVRSKAAVLQRSGKPVRTSMMEHIDRLIAEISDGERMLALRREEYKNVAVRYERYAERLKVLFGVEESAQKILPSDSATGLATSPSGGD